MNVQVSILLNSIDRNTDLDEGKQRPYRLGTFANSDDARMTIAQDKD